MTEYQKNFVRMLNSMRKQPQAEGSCIGEASCLDIDQEDCEKCPLVVVCKSDYKVSIFEADKAVEIVTQWAKEHHIVTNEDKYEEVFGVKPLNLFDGDYICPYHAGFTDFRKCECVNILCEECAKDFWQSEYKPSNADMRGGE